VSAVVQFRPRLGGRYQGGTYVGAIGTEHGTDHVIVGGMNTSLISWYDATSWARSLSISGWDDWRLPDAWELQVLRAGFPRLLQRERPVFWTCSTVPDLPSDAFVMDFGDGLISSWGKRHSLDALAVRRA
jgi:hypothetical protein